MNSLSLSRTQPKRARVLLVALGLILIVALPIPQLTWADHTDSDPAQFEVEVVFADAASSSGSSYGGASCDGSSDLDAELAEACEFFNALLVSYAAGEIEYNAPGR
jgi:hypothetical protein